MKIVEAEVVAKHQHAKNQQVLMIQILVVNQESVAQLRVAIPDRVTIADHRAQTLVHQLLGKQ